MEEFKKKICAEETQYASIRIRKLNLTLDRCFVNKFIEVQSFIKYLEKENQIKSKVIKNMCREINNAFSMIYQRVSLIQEGQEGDPLRFLEDISATASSMLTHMSTMLDYSESCSLNEMDKLIERG